MTVPPEAALCAAAAPAHPSPERAGDYEVVHQGAHHPELMSDTGALVFLPYTMPLENYVKL